MVTFVVMNIASHWAIIASFNQGDSPQKLNYHNEGKERIALTVGANAMCLHIRLAPGTRLLHIHS